MSHPNVVDTPVTRAILERTGNRPWSHMPVTSQAEFDQAVAKGTLPTPAHGEYVCWWPAIACLWGDAKLKANGGLVLAMQDSMVRAYGGAHVFAHGNATVVLHGGTVEIVSGEPRVLQYPDEGWSASNWPDIPMCGDLDT